MSLRYGLQWDRDALVDIAFWIQSIIPVISMVTVYPACFYLLFVTGTTMLREIRAAYLAYFILHLNYDVIFSLLMRVYAFPPYGLFYCEGILCTRGHANPFLMTVLASAVMLCIATFVFLTMRMHQMVVNTACARWKLSWRSQFAFMISLIVVCAVNVAGFVVFSTDVPNYESLAEVLFTLNPAQFALIFILRNDAHRRILRRRLLCRTIDSSPVRTASTITAAECTFRSNSIHRVHSITIL